MKTKNLINLSSQSTSVELKEKPIKTINQVLYAKRTSKKKIMKWLTKVVFLILINL